ncbi:MAG TPA: DUF6265 family protein [Gemmatimonadaceae bacterium]|nr:DUF6265 family protein [Gemmatimonadaceae bacterium]
MRYPVSQLAASAAVFVVLGAPAHQKPTPPLTSISFMAGCWTGPSSNGATIEERYSEAADNMVIGMTRYVRNGRVVDFEFTTIQRSDTAFVMTPHPKGVKSDPFALKEIADGRAVWENLKHDFPQRIIYRTGSDGTLVARIEGTTPRGERHLEWTMHRCDAR